MFQTDLFPSLPGIAGGSRKIRLADAIIWATAQSRAAILVTRNTKDFPRDDPGVRVPYEVV